MTIKYKQEESKMTKEHKQLLIELVKKERVRITVKLCNWYITEEQKQELVKERESANSLINFLQNDLQDIKAGE